MSLVPIDAPLRPALADGVHLNLSDEDYFGQDALGSTDLVSLSKKRWGWWWSSRHNRRRKEKVNKDRWFGTALHAIVLEGVAAYEARYAVEPDPREYPNAINTIPEMKKALTDAGFRLSGVSNWRAADWRAAMRTNMPSTPVWDNVLEDAKDRALGREMVSSDDDWTLRFMRDVANSVERTDNIDIRALFDDALPRMAEVSVFWTEAGVRRRARLDYMVPAFDLDLKSMGTWKGRPLPFEIGEISAQRGLDIQRADHFDARVEIYRAIAEGRVYGGSPEQRNWIATFPERAPEWDYVWMFYQKPDMTDGRAPVILPVYDHSWETYPGGERVPSLIRSYGMAKKATALDFYRHMVATQGLDTPWARVEPLHYTREVRDHPHISYPHWIAEEHPNAPEAYEVTND